MKFNFLFGRMAMKARVKNNKNILLSVGIITKNEEKNLPNCLEGLKPLLMAIPSELIIVDTGSTDQTKEIARKYTSKVYDFKWINDFSAARNETLKHASGEWYMYLDADEWIEDCRELIAFFSNKSELACYNSASITIRSFLDEKMTEQNDFYAPRIARRFPDTIFVGRVHEYIKVRYMPRKYIDCVARHFGYVSDNGKVLNKSKRNLPLLLESLDDPTTDLPHTYTQIANEYVIHGDIDKAMEYQRKGIDSLESDDIPERCALYHELVRLLCSQEKWDEALQIAQEYFSGKKTIYSTDVDIHLFLAIAWKNKNDPVKEQAELETYFRLRQLAEQRALDTADLLAANLCYTTVGYTNLAYFLYAILMDDTEPVKALENLEKIQGWNKIDANLYIEIESGCVIAAKAWDWYPNHYDVISNDEEWGPQRRRKMMAIWKAYPESHDSMGQALAKLDIQDDPFLLEVRLQQNMPDALETLEATLPTMSVTPYEINLLYYAMKENLDIDPFISRIDADELQDYIAVIDDWENAYQVITDYYQNYPNPPSLRGLRWKCTALEHILLQADVTDEVVQQNFISYVQSMTVLARALYKEPSEEALSIIPHVHRFAIYMGRAEAARRANKMAECVQYMVDAANEYPIMKHLVQAQIEAIRQDMNEALQQEQNRDAERASLYLQIKEKLRVLIEAGDFDNAAQILEQYQKLNPTDEAISYFWQKINNPVKPS